MKTAHGRVAVLLAFVTIAGALAREATAQRTAPPPPEPDARRFEHMRRPRMGARETVLAKMVTNPKVAAEIGLSDEQVAGLKSGLEELGVRLEELNMQLREAAREQGRLLLESEVDTGAVMTAVEKTGRIRTEIAKISVRQILLVKESISADQLEKLTEIMKSRDRRRYGLRPCE